MMEASLLGFPITVKLHVFSEVEVTYILVGMMSFIFSLHGCLCMEEGKIDIAHRYIDTVPKTNQACVRPLMLNVCQNVYLLYNLYNL